MSSAIVKRCLSTRPPQSERKMSMSLDGKRVVILGGTALIAAGAMALAPSLARSEILGMMNYETKSKESLKALKAPVPPAERREGIAIIDVDPASPAFGKILTDIPLPADLVAHHIFYNKDLSKAYVTALGKSELHVIDMCQCCVVALWVGDGPAPNPPASHRYC